ncbi:MAG: protein kinase [Tannerella sp.]|jgi:serine/threonine protein kinase|nr:protein kinase [Tannerella sp.]
MKDKTIYNYTLKYLLGTGGMAEVWYAESNIGKPAAIKILKEEFLKMQAVTDRFENEAKIMVKLDHPNIRQVHDFGKIDDRPCIVMEYLDGKDLSSRMKQGEIFDQALIRQWWNLLVETLNYTHKKGIVHRDIKPSNIFLTDKGEIKLLDFGIAKIRDSITATQTGSRMGTLIYMSPEQVKDSKHLDYRSDIYSLAVTFCHLLTGAAPYNNTNSSDFDIQLKIVSESLQLDKLPQEWKTFLRPYLEKEPENRPALEKFEYPQHPGINNIEKETKLFLEKDKAHEEPEAIQPLDPGKTRRKSIFSSRKAVIAYIVLAILAIGSFFISRMGEGDILHVVEQHPNETTDSLLLLGDNCFDKGDYDCAKLNYQTEKASGGSSEVNKKIEQTDKCLNILPVANFLFAEKDYQKAKSKYEELLAINPKDSYARRQIDSCQIQLKANATKENNQTTKHIPVDTSNATELKQRAIVGSVIFRANSSIIDSNQELNIFNVYEFAKKHNLPVRVTGYANKNFGPPSDRIKLSEKRARAVAERLNERYGIPTEKIAIEWKLDEKALSQDVWNNIVLMDVHNDVNEITQIMDATPHTVLFSSNSYEIDENQKFNIYLAAEHFKRTEKCIKVVGYVNKGDSESVDYDMGIAERRTRAVAKILNEKYGIPSEKISLEWKGDTKRPYEIVAWNNLVIIDSNIEN